MIRKRIKCSVCKDNYPHATLSIARLILSAKTASVRRRKLVGILVSGHLRSIAKVYANSQYEIRFLHHRGYVPPLVIFVRNLMVILLVIVFGELRGFAFQGRTKLVAVLDRHRRHADLREGKMI